MPAAGERQRTVVVEGAQPEAAVLLRDLHTQRAEPLESFDDIRRDVTVPLDRQWIHVLAQEGRQPGEECLAPVAVGRRRPWMR